MLRPPVRSVPSAPPPPRALHTRCVRVRALQVPALAAAVRAKRLPATDRIGLLSDHSALARAGKLDPVR